MTVGKQPLKLLRDVFTRDGKLMCSAVDTDTGRLINWLRLENAGLVKRLTKSGRSVMGHNYSFEITDAGKKAAEIN